MKFNFMPEECCDYCPETIHTHFSCPVCKNSYAGTTIYGDEIYKMKLGDTFSCEECETKFIMVHQPAKTNKKRVTLIPFNCEFEIYSSKKHHCIERRKSNEF